MSQNRPLVSVVLPTHNRAHLVGRAVESVLRQTWHDLELIVVDDGSSDETEQVVAGFEDHRIQYVAHNRNRGAAAARNTGIQISRGAYVAFLDSDDQWLPTKLEEQLKVFREGPKHLGVVYAGIEVIDLDRGESVGTRLPQVRGHILDSLLRRNVVVGSTSTALVRRDFLDKSGWFDECLPAKQDIDLWIRLARHCSFDYVGEVLARVYVHSDRISEDLEAVVEGTRRVFEKNRDALQENRKLLSDAQFLVGRELCRGGRMREGRDFIRRAIATYPLRTKYYGGLFASFLEPQHFERAKDTWGRLKDLLKGS